MSNSSIVSASVLTESVPKISEYIRAVAFFTISILLIIHFVFLLVDYLPCHQEYNQVL